MVRSGAKLSACCLVLAIVCLCVPNTFVTAPKTRVPGHWAPAAAAMGAVGAGALPSWAYTPEAVDAQLLLARIPGGKMTKERNLVVPSPEEDGFTDAQVALCLCIALVGFLAAIDLAWSMNKGLTPLKDPTMKNKGRITPLVKRFIEMGY